MYGKLSSRMHRQVSLLNANWCGTDWIAAIHARNSPSNRICQVTPAFSLVVVQRPVEVVRSDETRPSCRPASNTRPKGFFGQWSYFPAFEIGVAADRLGKNFLWLGWRLRGRKAAQYPVGKMQPVLLGKAKGRSLNLLERTHVRKVAIRSSEARRDRET